ncbi:MAG: Flagellar motor switch protein FliM [Firmicutes bacterium]|nr:Flagellar motor switch protein FliM [Bacillota bacterium]MDI6704679.1 flagellar motor switch protein FliM [Bacillota bacterium]
MPDVLTQSEIDELLKAISTGDLDVREVVQDTTEKKIRVYDFKRPNKFAKDQLRTLEMIHENYARLVSTFLSGYLRTFVTVDLISVEQLTYYEFTNSLSNPTIMAISEFRPLSGNIVVEVNYSITYPIIDRILGGIGKGEAKPRNFTEIELTIMRNMLEKMLNLLIEPWKNVIDITPVLSKLETNAQFVQIMSPNETIALITMRVKIGDYEGMMNLCIPHLSIEPIINKITTKYWFTSSNNRVSELDTTVLERRIENASVMLRVVLGECEITVEEFSELRVGDVLLLDKKCDEPLDMYVDNRATYRVKPGVKRNKLAVKVAEVIRRGDETGE